MDKQRLAKIISLVSSPFITATVAWAVVLATYADSVAVFAKLFGLLLLTAIGVPSLYIVYGVRKGSITDLHIKVRQQRFIPLSLAVVSSLVLAMLYSWIDAPHEVFVMAVAMAGVGALFTLVTLYWKVSFHVAVFTSGVLMVSGLVNWEWLWSLLLLPAIIWARIVRRRHDIWQALAGIALAVLTVLGMMYWLL